MGATLTRTSLTGRMITRRLSAHNRVYVLTIRLRRMSSTLPFWASRYSSSARHNFDIYLPEWLAKYNKQIYTVIVVIILLLLAWRLVA